MIDPQQFLHEKSLQPAGLEKKPTRDGFGIGSVEAGKADERIVVLSADLSESTRAEWFQKEFPKRFIEMGVAEQNMATVAAGMAGYGKIPFITSYAAFSPGRNWEQIRTTIAINDVPVIICGMHAGLQTGPDGATHQMLEDIALMRAMPNMTVVVPADAEEARKATIAAAKLGKPAYLRFGRSNLPVFTSLQTPFSIGRANILRESAQPEVALIACGALVHTALLAAHELEAKGVGTVVVNNHTIKPLDEDTLLAVAKKTGAIVALEEHQMNGGLGGAVAELVSKHHPVPIEMIAVQDMFGQSGTPDELLGHYGLDVTHVAAAARAVRARK